jgi:putative ABC transport system permease protein
MAVWELRCAIRRFCRNRSISAVAVSTLALGLGSATSIFSVINATLLRPLPGSEPGRLIAIVTTNDAQAVRQGRASMGDFFEWRRQARNFADIAAIGPAKVVLTQGGEPEEVPAAAVSANFFRVLGVHPALGRGFLPEEEVPGRDRVVLLSRALWQRRFGADPGVLGSTVQLSGEPYLLVGVMPPAFELLGRKVDIWSPMAMDSRQLVRARRGLEVVARLRAGATIEQAAHEMRAIAQRAEHAYPETNAGWGAAVLPLQEWLVGKLRPMLALLFGATALVLLIACVNVVNLLFAQNAARQGELALRVALGATPPKLLGQFLLEALLLTLSGGLLGLPLAYWGGRLLVSANPRVAVPLDRPLLAPGVLLFMLGLAAGVGVLLGLATTLRSCRPGRLAGTRELHQRGRSGNAMVVAEVSVALLLLISSGLLLRSFLRLRSVDPGFRPDHALVVNLFLPPAKYPEEAQQTAFFGSLLERIRTLPGVVSAATTTAVPMSSKASTLELPFSVDGAAGAEPGVERRAGIRLVSPGYFRTMGIQVAAGREFTDHDRPGARRVAVVNEAMVRRLWPREVPLGKTLGFDYHGRTAVEIVGIAGDVRHFGLNREPEPELYLPSAQFPSPFASLVVRTKEDPQATLAEVKSRIWDLDREQALTFDTLEEIISSSFTERRFLALLLATFAALSLVLTAVGVYGLVAYSTSRRTAEIGIRMALGARRTSVLNLVMGRSLAFTSLGILIGLALAAAAGSLLQQFLYEISTRDALTFAGAALLVAASALLGSYLPARKAARMDPLAALRSR